MKWRIKGENICLTARVILFSFSFVLNISTAFVESNNNKKEIHFLCFVHRIFSHQFKPFWYTNQMFISLAIWYRNSKWVKVKNEHEKYIHKKMNSCILFVLKKKVLWFFFFVLYCTYKNEKSLFSFHMAKDASWIY